MVLHCSYGQSAHDIVEAKLKKTYGFKLCFQSQDYDVDCCSVKKIFRNKNMLIIHVSYKIDNRCFDKIFNAQILNIDGKFSQNFIKGHLLSENDIIWGKSISNICINSFIGKRLNNNVKAGAKIESILFDEYVAHGTIVDAYCESFGIRLSTKAKLIDGGRVGDKIKAINISSNKIFEAHIISNEKIEAICTG